MLALSKGGTSMGAVIVSATTLPAALSSPDLRRYAVMAEKPLFCLVYRDDVMKFFLFHDLT